MIARTCGLFPDRYIGVAGLPQATGEPLDTAIAELEAMTPRNSQWLPTGEEIPEKHPVYRWAKRIWFNDFGVYDGLERQGPKS